MHSTHERTMTTMMPTIRTATTMMTTTGKRMAAISSNVCLLMGIPVFRSTFSTPRPVDAAKVAISASSPVRSELAEMREELPSSGAHGGAWAARVKVVVDAGENKI